MGFRDLLFSMDIGYAVWCSAIKLLINSLPPFPLSGLGTLLGLGLASPNAAFTQMVTPFGPGYHCGVVGEPSSSLPTHVRHSGACL